MTRDEVIAALVNERFGPPPPPPAFPVAPQVVRRETTRETEPHETVRVDEEEGPSGSD